MIVIHEGVPGAGKSYDAVRKIIDALKIGRIVYTNIDGINKPECLEYIAHCLGISRDALALKLFFLQQGQIANFWQYCEPGALVVIDEAQLFFNSRDFSKSSNREFADWASTHRHHGYDLILITQRAERIDTAVRSLAEFRYRYRKLSFMGAMFAKGFLVYSYCGDDPKPLNFSKRTYDKKVFPAYNSYQGDASEKKFQKMPNLFKHPVFFILPVVLGITIFFGAKGTLFSGSLSAIASGKVEKADPVKPASAHPFQPAQRGGSPAMAESAIAEPAIEGLPVIVQPAEDTAYTFKASAFVRLPDRQIVQVYGVTLYAFAGFDAQNMLVTLKESQFPLALKMKLKQMQLNPDDYIVSASSASDPETDYALAYYDSLNDRLSRGTLSIVDSAPYKTKPRTATTEPFENTGSQVKAKPTEVKTETTNP